LVLNQSGGVIPKLRRNATLAYLNLRMMINSVVDERYTFVGLFVAVEENPPHRPAGAARLCAAT
jgi:hypothetical protein